MDYSMRDAGCGFLWPADTHHIPQTCCLLHIDAVLMKLKIHAFFLTSVLEGLLL